MKRAAGQGLLDTSTLILLPRLTDPTSLPEEPLISCVTLAELAVGPLVTESPKEQRACQAHLQQAEAVFEPLAFDAQAARAFGRVAASLRRAGRKASARSYDVMIAAIAVSNGLPIYTSNPDDFTGNEDLEVIAVPHPELSG